jgi:DNA adenine methylase
MSEVRVKRPALRYHGGKWKLAPWIIAHFPVHRVYVEPYGGAASVLLRKPRAYAEVYNDLDGEVVNLFRVLRDPAQGAWLREQLALTPFAREEFTLSYAPAENALEQARRTVVRSFMGFGSAAASGYNTGFRCNSNRSGTTPAHDWANYPAALAAIIERLQGVVIECRDAVAVLQHHDGPETLHYVDPPYPTGTRRSGSRYCNKGQYRHEMSDDDHRALAAVLHGLQGMVVLSGYPCPLYDEALYSDWHRVERAALADGARARTEVLWLNAAAAAGLRQGELFGRRAR